MRLSSFSKFHPEGDNPDPITDHQLYGVSRCSWPMTGRGSRGGGRSGRGSRGGKMYAARTIDYSDDQSGSGNNPNNTAPNTSADYTKRLLEAQQRMALQRSQHLLQGQRGHAQIPPPAPAQRPQEFSVDPFRLYAKVFFHIYLRLICKYPIYSLPSIPSSLNSPPLTRSTLSPLSLSLPL